MKLQKRSKFEEIVNNKPLKIITKPDYTDVSNDFHISNIRDFDYDIEKQILDNKKELIQSDLLNEITTRMQRQDEKIKNVLDKTQKEIPPNILTTHQMNSDNSPEGETEDIFTRENIDMAMELAEKEATKKAKEEEATKDSTTTKPLNIKKSPHFEKKRRKPTNKGKSQANDESMAKQMEVDAPTEKAEGMNIETSGVKRVVEEIERNIKNIRGSTKERLIKKARQGDELVPNFLNILGGVSIPVIQQQMIMQGIPFNVDKKEKREELFMIINSSTWSDSVKKETVDERLKQFKDKYGFLPLENIKASDASSSKQGEKRASESSENEPKAKAKSQTASSSSEPKAKSQAASSSSEPKAKSQAASSSSEPKAKSQAASSSSEPKAKSQAASSSSEPKAKSQAASSSSEPKAKSQAASSSSEPKAKSQAASSSSDPKPKLTLPKGELLKEEEEPDIDRHQQTPIVSPRKARGNITVLTEHVKSAFNKGLIIDNKDLVLYVAMDDAKEIAKMKDKKEKKRVLDDLLYLYKKYVYEPSLKSFHLSPKSSPKGVKKTIQKEK